MLRGEVTLPTAIFLRRQAGNRFPEGGRVERSEVSISEPARSRDFGEDKVGKGLERRRGSQGAEPPSWIDLAERRLGGGGQAFFCLPDGSPAGSAGSPVLQEDWGFRFSAIFRIFAVLVLHPRSNGTVY